MSSLANLMPNPSTRQKKWAKRALLLFVSLAVICGGIRVVNWISPPTPAVYRIAYDSTWYPLSLYGKDKEVTAFSIDLLFAVARSQDIQVEVLQAGYQRLFELLEDEKVTGILSSLSPETVGQGKYLFSNPYYKFGAVLVVQKGIKIESIETLPKQRIAVKRGSSILFHLSLDPTVIIVPYDSPIIALDELSKGNVDGVLMDHLLAYLYFRGLHGKNLQVATMPLTVDGLRLVTLNDRVGAELIEKFNQGLQNLKDTGKYQELLGQWELYDSDILP